MFNVTHKTPDNSFEVNIDVNKGFELYFGLAKKILVRNTETKQITDVKLYKSKKGVYFKGNKLKYYLHELNVL